jgi:hypothetical protein
MACEEGAEYCPRHSPRKVTSLREESGPTMNAAEREQTEALARAAYHGARHAAPQRHEVTWEQLDALEQHYWHGVAASVMLTATQQLAALMRLRGKATR